MTIIEVNSCPGLMHGTAFGNWEMMHFHRLISESFIPWLHTLPCVTSDGSLAVLNDSDKTYGQARTFAIKIAQLAGWNMLQQIVQSGAPDINELKYST